MKSRTKARSLALQVLYEVDLTNHLPGVVFEERLAELPMSDELAEFSRQIITGVLATAVPIDEFIVNHAPEWPLDQVAIIDRNILRIALWEFGINGSTPMKVAINEAVELAKYYGSESSSRFVNGVLGSLANHENEIRQLFAASPAVQNRKRRR